MTSDDEREEADAPEGREPAPPTIAPSALRAATRTPEGDSGGPGDALDLEVDPGSAADDDLREPAGPDAAPDQAASPAAGGSEREPGDDGDEEPPGPAPDEETTRLWRAVPLETRVEALLFAATAPLSLRRLQTLAGGEDPGRVREALAALDAHYESSGRAFSVVELGGGFQLRTRAELSDLLAATGRRTSTEKLTPAAIETLAIVAYRQPVLRIDVEKIRGVASGDVLRGLIEKGLVRVAGRADLPGAPLLYGTTPAFLELFGLRDLKDLPSDGAALRRPV